MVSPAAGSSSVLLKKMRRVATMDGHELAVRLGQEVSKRSDVALCRMGVDLTPSITSQEAATPAFFFSLEELPDMAAVLHEALPQEAEKTVRYARRLLDHRFDLLGWQDIPCGEIINWHSDPVHGHRTPAEPWYRIPFLDFDAVGDHKVVWELNRHQHLVTLAKAWHLTGNDTYATEAFRQWRDWQAKNPYPLGINWASSLEVAFRSLSWIWLDRLLAACPVRPHDFDDELARALAIAARHIERYISTYFAPNTHLLGEGVALFFTGLLYPKLQPASRWRDRGWQIVLEQARSQVHPDGMHFEQATYYHVYALDFLLHARMLAARNAMDIPAELDDCIEKMLEVLCNLSQAGSLPRFGDDDGGRLFDPGRNRPEHMTDPLSTGAVLFGRADFKAAAGTLREETLWLCGVSANREFESLQPEQPHVHPVALDSAGIYAMAAAGPPRRQLFIDAGPHGVMSGGHGHADALSVQLAVGGRMWLIDPGACRYVGDSDARDRFRNTAAHNTMEVDGVGQADPLAPFTWGSMPSVRQLHWTGAPSFALFAGEHDGYSRLSSPVIHRRWVFGLDDGVWLVRDMALGAGTHDLALSWHLAPFLRVEAASSTVTRLDGEDDELLLFTPEQDDWNRKVSQTEWSPAYGITEPAPLLRFSTRTSAPAETALLIMPANHSAAATSGTLHRVENSYDDAPRDGSATYRYQSGDTEIYIFFRASHGQWEIGEWASDARFMYAVLQGGEPQRLGFVDGSHVQYRGHSLVDTGGTRPFHDACAANQRTSAGMIQT